MKRIVHFGVFGIALCWTVLGSAADTIYQKGSTNPLVGTIVETKETGIQVSMGGGTTTVARDRIERVEIPQPASLKDGIEALQKGAWVQAVKVFEPLYVRYKGLPQNWLEEMTIRLGQAYVEVKEWSKARELCTTFCKYYPESQFRDLSLSIEARALVGLNKLADAKGILEGLTKKNEDEASKTKEGVVNEEQNRALGPAFVVLGKCYLAAKEDDKALESFLKTTTIYYRDPNAVAEALYESALLFEKMKNSARARDQLEDLIKDYPTTPFVVEAKKKLDSLKATAP